MAMLACFLELEITGLSLPCCASISRYLTTRTRYQSVQYLNFGKRIQVQGFENQAYNHTPKNMKSLLSTFLLLPAALATQILTYTASCSSSSSIYTYQPYPPSNTTYSLHTSLYPHWSHTYTYTNPHPYPTSGTGTGTISHHPSSNSTTFHSPTLSSTSTSTRTTVATLSDVTQTPASTWAGTPEAPMFTDAAGSDAVFVRWRVGWVVGVLVGSLAVGF